MNRVKKGYEQAGVAMTCRGYAEYEAMFQLNIDELRGKRILDVAGGASSFAAEAAEKGCAVSAADPMYAQPHALVYEHGLKEIEESTEKLRNIQDVLDWAFYGSLDQHQRMRCANLERFIRDYRDDEKRKDRTYAAASLPNLPYADETFDLVLCSHFLFLYADQFTEAFHYEAIKELIRVCCGQVRIYPLVSLVWKTPDYLEALMGRIESEFPVKCEQLKSTLPFVPGPGMQLCISRI